MACLTDRSLDQFLQVSVNSGAGPVVVKVHEIGPIALQWIRAPGGATTAAAKSVPVYVRWAASLVDF